MIIKERFGEYFSTVILPTIVAFIFSFLTTFFFGTSSISVGQPVKVSDQYFTPINISAYKDIDKLKITFPTKINENQISSNKPLHIKSVDNNIGIENNSTFEISEIAKDNSVQLLINTKKTISDKDISINKSGNSISVHYESAVINPAVQQLVFIIITTLVIFLVLNYFAWRSDKRWKEMQDQIQVMENRTHNLEKLKADLQDVKNDSIKARILFMARLNDYKKELSFWRNTIRKTLYDNTSGDEKAQKLIETVTSSLKTYNTNEKNMHDFETIKVAAALLRDSDEKS
ncbi:hypothetical protein ABE187_14855 [Bacillus cabrialesii]|uniref:hypothetical protein n=1 Tax=Bacillus cabrialesii TaxID=2487276 RepID=UPI003D1DDDA2